jgi:hypothetical protein
MKLPREILGRVGQCIYCRTTQKPLQSEHIVPYALNGPWELLEASCQKCAEITSSFETDVCHNLLLQTRAKLIFPTRHKYSRPAVFPLTIESKGQKKSIQVPLQEHPTPISFPIFPLPAYIDQRHYQKGIDITGHMLRQVGGPPVKEITKRHDAESLSFKVTYQPIAFARLLAKIAYGFTVATYGLNMVQEAYVLPAILGQSDDIGRWVGCTANDSVTPGRDLHRINLKSINGEIHCNVRLFTIFNTPEYLVIVGRASEHLGV